ncbi:uncharacterized membrane protein YhaH (DUF805 family) [Leucobacter luti]|uniref:Uncharacterized membrane protein YhaH (DUF805 family) n=1 Tax=Leucobacter luti TaxID=340320 RepID=A0A4R6S6Y6_9MICO|nr:DUF805 domain-containing protein [Leucobacter luti]MCW2288815.1 uncharacterized membrane protein YhaH (DUF805 family) [Leucobacter luti]TCK45034.1 uncharacterized membrane protein YhaH (DUF805 family) [Leucobacter luti]TDP95560.1 uncharacterized membrane protein YhaH (DUF805 family) [Leucobacter luti]
MTQPPAPGEPTPDGPATGEATPGASAPGDQAPEYAAPQYAPPVYPTQQPAPQYAAPQYAAPQYAAPAQPPVYAGTTELIPGPGEPFDGAADPADSERPLYGASFGQAISRFFRGYARFSGRASRSEYWFSMLFLALIRLALLVVMGIGAIIGESWEKQQGYTSFTGSDGTEFSSSHPSGIVEYAPAAILFFAAVILFVLTSLAFLIPSLAIAWRRLHDGNFAGPLWFLSLIPYGGIAVFVLTLLRSKPAGRRFDLPRS